MAVVSGVLSSSDVTSLIQQASAKFQAPANTLLAQEKPVQDQISALGKVQGVLSSLQSAFAGLADVQTLAQRSVTVSPSGAVKATAANDAAAGSYNLSNIHLAESENLLSTGFPSTGAGLGAGALAIQVGGGPALTVTVGPGQDNLTGIANAINQANAGVQATILYDGSSYHLALNSTATGKTHAFTVSGSGGLAGFTYAPGASGLTEVQAAANASFSINGLAVTSGSNTVSSVVPGLTLTLAASGSATVTVQQDITALDKAANAVVSALNNVLTTISQYGSYSLSSGAGPLFGDIGVQVLRTDLLDAVTEPAVGGSAPNSPYASLSAVGFTVNSDGTVSLDDAAFQSAAESNYTAVAALLGGAGTASDPNVSVRGIGSAKPGSYAVDITTNAGGSVTGTVNGEAASGTGGLLVVTGTGAAAGLSLQISPGVTGSLGEVTVGQGLFGRLSGILNAALATDSGSVTGEIKSLNSSLTSMNNQITALQQQAQQETLALTKQFGAAQATLSQLETVSNFLTTYFNQTSGVVGGVKHAWRQTELNGTSGVPRCRGDRSQARRPDENGDGRIAGVSRSGRSGYRRWKSTS
jgi:flagellar hook-associated protein 2